MRDISGLAGVRNTVLLAIVLAAGLINGLSTEQLPAWRQGLCALLALAAFLHGRYLPVHRAWPVFAGGLAAGLASWLWRPWDTTTVLSVAVVFVALPWLAGRYLRQRAELIEAGQARIAALERVQRIAIEGARLRERTRIAADLHDAIGHELALVALRAGALELDAAVPEKQREAAMELRKAAVGATDRLRRTLGMLRVDEPARDGPWNEDLDDLVARVRTAGMKVAFTRTGAGYAPPLVDRALHRVAQEALTNAARHAPGEPVTVRLASDGHAYVLTIANPMPGPPVPADGGSGLAGLRERVGLVGGTLDAAAGDGVFTVRARIPGGNG